MRFQPGIHINEGFNVSASDRSERCGVFAVMPNTLFKHRIVHSPFDASIPGVVDCTIGFLFFFFFLQHGWFRAWGHFSGFATPR